MINVPDDVKKLYESDVLPGTVTLVIDGREWPATGWLSGSLSIFEALCSKDVLSYSTVEANTLEVELASEGGNAGMAGLAGKEIVALQKAGNPVLPSDSLKPGASLYPTDAEIPLGTFTISETSFDGDYYCKIKAYDPMKKFIDTDITDWWINTVEFPVTIHDLLIGLCNYCGVKHALPDTWTNSTVFVEKNAVMDSFKASELLGMIQEACGLFFHTDRYGRMKVVTHDAAVTEIPYTALYEDVEIADYEAPAIQGVQIKSSDDDIGILYGQNKNVYQINNNFLLYNKKDSEYQAIAKNILANIGGHGYHPFSAKVKARNYVEIGDPVKITSYKGNTSQFWLLSRKMCDDGLITDEISVKGKANTVNNTVSSKKTTQVLNRRIHTLKNTLDELNSSFESIETTQKGTVASVTTYWLQTVEGSPPATTDPGWSTTPAIFKQGYHIWQMTKTVYIDPERPAHYSDPVEITTPDVVSITPYYRLSASESELYDWLYPGDSTYPEEHTYPSDTWTAEWHTDYPDWEPGMYLWIKQLIKYTDGSEKWTEPIVDAMYTDATSTVTTYSTEIKQTNQRIDTKAEASTVTSYYNDLIGRIDQEKIDRDSEIEQTAKSINEKVTSVASAAVRGMNVYYKTSVSKESPDSDGYTYPGDSTMPGENTYPTLPITSDFAWSETEPQPTAGHYLWCTYHLTYFDETTQKEVTKDIIRLGKLESTAYNLAINNSASLTILDNSVSLNASRIETLDGDINEQSAKFLVAYNQITSEVSKKVGNDEIISKINQTPEEIKIQANKITLEGIITANNNFKVLKDGSIEAKNGKFSGELTFGVAPNTVVMKTSDDNDGANISGAGKVIIHSVNGVFIKSLNGDTKGSSNDLSMGIKDNSYIFSLGNSVYGSSSTSTDADNTANLIKLTETSDHSRTIFLKNNGYNSNYDYNDVYLTGSSSSNQISLRNHSKLAPSSTGNSLFMSSGSTGTSFTRIYNYRATSSSSTALAATLQLYSSYKNSGASNLDTSVSAKVYEANGSTLAANCEIWKDYDPSNPLNHFALTCRDGNGNTSTGIAGTSDGVVRIYGASAAILYAGVNSTKLYISDGSKSHLVFNAASDYTYLDHDGNTSIRQGSNGVDIFYDGGWHSFKKVYRLSSSSGDHMVSDTYGEGGYKTEAYFYVLDYVNIAS